MSTKSGGGIGFGHNISADDKIQLEKIAKNKIERTREERAEYRVTEGQGSLPSRVSVNSVEGSEPVSAPEPVEPPTQPIQPAPQPVDQNAIFEQMIQRAMSAQVAPIQQELSATREQLNAAQSALQETNQRLQQVEAEKRDLSALADALQVHGRAEGYDNNRFGVPAFQKGSNPRRENPKGLAAELVNSLERSYSMTVVGDEIQRQRDPKELHKLYWQAKREEEKTGHNQLLAELEDWGRDIGMLASTNSVAGPMVGSDAALRDLYLDVLSEMTRLEHNQHNVWHQFPTTVYDATSAPGKNVLVPRFTNLTQPTSLSDYELATFNSFTPIVQATGSSADSQSVVMSTIPVGVIEYGIGKAGAIGQRPVYLPQFNEMMGLRDQVRLIFEKLGQNYFAFEDLLVRVRFAATTQILYNKANEIETDATALDVADDGTMTREFLGSVYAQMFANRIPALPDGCYHLVANPTAIKQLKASYGKIISPSTQAEVEDVTALLTGASGVEIGRVSGYVGKFEGFHVFATNSSGVGAAGTEGVVNVNTEGDLGTVTFNDSYAFGAGAVARGIAQPFEVRPSGVRPYNRGESFIWLSREGSSVMDVDSAIVSPAGQQTRVYKLRTARKAFITTPPAPAPAPPPPTP